MQAGLALCPWVNINQLNKQIEVPYSSNNMEIHSVSHRNTHTLPQEAPLSMWLPWGSNLAPSVSKADS